MPEGIIVSLDICQLGIIVSLEGGIVLDNIMGFDHKCVSEHPGAVFGHQVSFH